MDNTNSAQILLLALIAASAVGFIVNYCFFSEPTGDAKIALLHKKAKNDLINAEIELEHWQSQVTMLKARVERLKMGLPAPEFAYDKNGL